MFYTWQARTNTGMNKNKVNRNGKGYRQMSIEKVCIVGASGKLGQYMVGHALARGYQVVGVCRERSVDKLAAYKDRITIIPGATNDRQVIRQAVAGCDGVLTVLVPWGMDHYSSGTSSNISEKF